MGIDSLDKKNGQPRRLYKIGQVTKLLGITSRTIRYYDNSGLLPHVKRSKGQIRLFDESDLEIIRQIRSLQKEGLQLDAIRTQLFGKRLFDPRPMVHDRVAIVTDSSVCFPPQFNLASVKIVEVPKSVWFFHHQEMPSSKELGDIENTFIAQYTQLAEAGIQTVYSVHITESISPILGIARLAAHKVSSTIRVEVVDSLSMGATLGLVVAQLSEAIENGNTVSELGVFLSKQANLIWGAGMANSITTLIENELIDLPQASVVSKSVMLNKLAPFVPVFQLGASLIALDIIDCCKNQSEALETLIQLVISEIEARGNYVHYIWIHHHDRMQEVVALQHRLHAHYPKAQLEVVEDHRSLPTFIGSHYVAVSIG